MWQSANLISVQPFSPMLWNVVILCVFLSISLSAAAAHNILCAWSIFVKIIETPLRTSTMSCHIMIVIRFIKKVVQHLKRKEEDHVPVVTYLQVTTHLIIQTEPHGIKYHLNSSKIILIYGKYMLWYSKTQMPVQIDLWYLSCHTLHYIVVFACQSGLHSQ